MTFHARASSRCHPLWQAYFKGPVPFAFLKPHRRSGRLHPGSVPGYCNLHLPTAPMGGSLSWQQTPPTTTTGGRASPASAAVNVGSWEAVEGPVVGQAA